MLWIAGVPPACGRDGRGPKVDAENSRRSLSLADRLIQPLVVERALQGDQFGAVGAGVLVHSVRHLRAGAALPAAASPPTGGGATARPAFDLISNGLANSGCSCSRSAELAAWASAAAL